MNTAAPRSGRVRALLKGGALAAVALALLTMQGTTMAKMVLFSAVKGRVLQQGKPVAGATIERTFKWSWKDETGTDGTQTGADGSFALPPIERRSLLGSFLPHEPVVDQTILIKHGGQTYQAWMLFKRDYDTNGELKGRPIVLTCRLENPPTRKGDVFGICEME